jgi:membrane-associated phospholipid phosphatase
MKRFEPLLPLVFVILHGFLYNEIGELAAARQIDLGPVIEIPLDAWIPFVPVFVLPYIFAWFFPVGLIGYLMVTRIEANKFRPMSVAMLVLALGSYALWIAFPVQEGLRVDESSLAAHGRLGQLVLFIYQGSSQWNSFPSFHVAGPWLIYRAARLMAPRLPRFFFWAFVAIALSTVLIRIHYAVDIVGGLLISELVIRMVFKPLYEARTQERVPSGSLWRP